MFARAFEQLLMRFSYHKQYYSILKVQEAKILISCTKGLVLFGEISVYTEVVMKSWSAIDLFQHYEKQKLCTWERNTRHKVTLLETDGKAVSFICYSETKWKKASLSVLSNVMQTFRKIFSNVLGFFTGFVTQPSRRWIYFLLPPRHFLCFHHRITI